MKINGKGNTETYITICKIDCQREFAVCLRKLNRSSVSTERAGMGGRWEGVSKKRGCMYTYG